MPRSSSGTPMTTRRIEVTAVIALGSVVAIGAAEGALDAFRAHLATRQSANGTPPAWPPTAQIRFAQATTLLRMANLVVDDLLNEMHYAAEHAAGRLTIEQRVQRMTDTAMIHALARDAVSALADAAGAGMYRCTNPLQRMQRDIDVMKGHIVADWDLNATTAGQVLLGQALRDSDLQRLSLV